MARETSIETTRSRKSIFDGWQLAVVTLSIAWGTALVVIPRSVVPRDLPPDPFIEPRSARAIAAKSLERARLATIEPLSARTRAVGTAIRAYGRAEASDDRRAATSAKAALDEAAKKLPSLEETLRLRAYQAETFLSAVRAWESTGVVSDDLDELGGNFIRVVVDNGWVETIDGRRAIAMEDLARRASFEQRWNQLVGVKSADLEPPLDESRALLGFSLRHPPRRADVSPAIAAQVENETRLKKIDELAKIDPTYPWLYARGVVRYRLGDYSHAVQDLARYLEQSPSGPYAVRAANHLRASLDAEAEQ